MAIGTRTSPQLAVIGRVTNTRDITRRAATDSGPAGEFLGVNLTVETPSGEKLQVASWERNPIPEALSAVGASTALIVTVDEGARGANLTFDRPMNENDLELISAILRDALATTSSK